MMRESNMNIYGSGVNEEREREDKEEEEKREETEIEREGERQGERSEGGGVRVGRGGGEPVLR